MQVALASHSSASSMTDGFVASTARVVVFVDGMPAGSRYGTGCEHSTAWFVRRLGAAVVDILETPTGFTPAEDLAQAIVNVNALHMSTCQLGHDSDPAAGIAILREQPDLVEFLVIGTMHVLLDEDGEVTVVRSEAESTESVRSHPDIADRAVTGVVKRQGLIRAAVVSSGVAGLARQLGATPWSGLLDLLERHGPGHVIDRVRTGSDVTSTELNAEAAVFCQFGQDF